jgi:hypothetical protein
MVFKSGISLAYSLQRLVTLKNSKAANDPNAPMTENIIGESFSRISIQKSGIAFLNKVTALLS